MIGRAGRTAYHLSTNGFEGTLVVFGYQLEALTGACPRPQVPQRMPIGVPPLEVDDCCNPKDQREHESCYLDDLGQG